MTKGNRARSVIPAQGKMTKGNRAFFVIPAQAGIQGNG
jgi:hypothetical protein